MERAAEEEEINRQKLREKLEVKNVKGKDNGKDVSDVPEQQDNRSGSEMKHQNLKVHQLIYGELIRNFIFNSRGGAHLYTHEPPHKLPLRKTVLPP